MLILQIQIQVLQRLRGQRCRRLGVLRAGLRAHDVVRAPQSAGRLQRLDGGGSAFTFLRALALLSGCLFAISYGLIMESCMLLPQRAVRMPKC